MKNSTHKAIGIFSASLLTTAAAAYIFSPVIGTHADSSATADINLSVGEVMSLTLNTNSLNLSTNPNSFVSGTITATTSTNSQYGYTLTLEDLDDSANMVHSNANIDAVVTSTFDGTKTSSNMTDNTWGYSLNATDFSKIPVNGSAATLKRTTVPMTTASESTDVTFGAKVGNLTSGTYTDKVVFTAYVNGQDGKPITSMQGFSCSSLENVGDSTVLRDTRDGNNYTVKKLADGKCWMTENLRIAGKTITPADSNVTSDFTIPASSVSGFDAQDTNNAYVDSTYGGYYTFYTATAGTGGTSLASGDAPSSICPKGWRLPTGGSSGEFNTLYGQYNSAALMMDVPNFVLSDYVYNGSVRGQGGDSGRFWSSSVYDANRAYFLALGSYFVRPADRVDKFLGFPVRCVAQ